jgi:acetyltransferase-like isoleucine patch superfamily enzyme
MGVTIVLNVRRIELGPAAQVGHLNVIRGLRRFAVGEQATIGMLNWFSAAPFLIESTREEVGGVFEIGRASAFTSRHYVDASGGVHIGEYTTIAGVRTTFMTHGIEYVSNLLHQDSIRVGNYVMIGGNTKVVMGSVVPDRSVVAMGACVVPGLSEGEALYAGVPARFKKKISDAAYWHRLERRVFAANDSRRADSDPRRGVRHADRQ